MVVQMSGLLLLVPIKEQNGGMNVLMPKMDKHRALIGFTHAKEDFCSEYFRDICYVDLDLWSVSPVGVASTGSPRIPGGAFDLTLGSGSAKVDTMNPHVKGNLRAQLAVLSGSATDSCGLSTWNFDPVGNPGVRKVSAINVLEWQIPNVSETVVLVLQPRAGGNAKQATLRANDAHEIELLIVHVTDEEAAYLTSGKKRSADLAGPVRQDSVPLRLTGDVSVREDTDHGMGSPSQTARKHFQAFYGLVTQDRTKWRQPARPKYREELCPITILGLEDLFIGVDREELFGVSTFSCVMASAGGA
jgi:hypothetical protein